MAGSVEKYKFHISKIKKKAKIKSNTKTKNIGKINKINIKQF